MKFYPLLFRDTLHIGWRSYRLEKLQCEGEYELTDVAKKAKFEAEWVFSNNPNTFFYSPSKHTESNKRFSVELRLHKEKIFRNSSMSSQLTHYHIHPSKAKDYLLKQISKKKPKNLEELTDIQLLDSVYLSMGVPSDDDVRFFAHLYRFPYDDFAIATEKGITKISFREEGPVDIRIPLQFEREWNGKRFRGWFRDNVSRDGNNFESLFHKLLDDINKDIFPMELKFVPRAKILD